MPVSVEIVIIGSGMHVSLEMVVIGSNYASFCCNPRSWLKLCAFHSEKFNLARNTRVAFEMVGVCLDCK